jgi:signal peptidase I
MAPTIQPNEVIVADMSAYRKASPRRWDVVVFHPPQNASREETVWPIRVVGLPGERISLETDGIHIDGKVVPQPDSIHGIRYAASDPRVRSPIAFPYTIPAESYFLLGDNTADSFDSRFWGAVPMQSILGRVRNK